MFKPLRPQSGLTLIELLITLAIISVLIASATPSMREIIQNNRATTQVNELQASLNIGRSEAITRNSTVTVCQSSNGLACTGQWQDGWIVFVDDNSDRDVDDGDQILRVHGSLAAENSLRFLGTGIQYTSSGLASTGSNGVFIHCDPRGASHAQAIIIGPTGRARLYSDSQFRELLEDREDRDRLDSFICSSSS